MARIQWHGATYSATPKQELDNGDWLMTMAEHGPRFTIGTVVRVSKTQIVEMAAAEMPAPTPAESAAALDKAMAEERKSLPTVEELLANNSKEGIDGPQEIQT